MPNIEELVAKTLTYCTKRKTTIREAIGKIVPQQNLRPLVKALSINIAKNYILLDTIAREKLSIDIERLDEYSRNILRTIIYEIRYRNIRIRERLLRKFKINKADIRNIKRLDEKELTSNLKPLERLEILYSMPRFIINRLLIYVKDLQELEELLRYYMREPTRYVRINVRNVNPIEIVKKLRRKGIECYQDIHFEDLIVIERSRINITKLEEYKRGIIHPQDKASIAISRTILEDCKENNAIFVDTTAGPGNKSSYVAQHGVYSIGIEISRRRLMEIDRNIKRIGVELLDYLQGDSIRIPIKIPNRAILLIDPDCTSIGRLHINPEIKLWLTEEDIRKRSERQYKLISSIIECSPKNVKIYYCTCTLTYEENEQNIIRTVENYNIYIQEININISTRSRILRKCNVILPHMYKCTGMFIAKIIK